MHFTWWGYPFSGGVILFQLLASLNVQELETYPGGGIAGSMLPIPGWFKVGCGYANRPRMGWRADAVFSSTADEGVTGLSA